MKSSWQTKKLGEVCDVVNGGTPKTNVKKYWDGDILWITPKDMGRLENIYVEDTARKITKDGLKESSAKIIPPHSIILSTRAPIGHLAINTKEISTNQGCKGLIPNKNLYTKFFYYFLEDSVELLNSLGSGTTFKELSGTKLKEVEMYFPPLAEQKRIVKILDEVFVDVAKAKENAEKNLQNAKELFGSYLQNVFANPGKDWEEKRFDEVCVLQRGFDLPARLRKRGGFPLVSSNGITDRINLWKVEAPGVVTGRSGTIGNVYFIEEKFWPLNTALYIKDFHNNDERFIFYFLKQFDLSKHSSGAGVPTLNRNNVHSITVTIPKSLSEQKAIVKKLDALWGETKRLEAIFRRKIADLDELKKAVLKKAFAGEL